MRLIFLSQRVQLSIARLFLIFVLCCISACTDDVQLSSLHKDAVVLAFGDSLTFGTGAASAQSYPAQLAQLIRRKVVNTGIPGELSGDGLTRLPQVLDKHQPTLLILCHGGNDFLRRKSLQRIKSNIAAMITMAKTRNIEVVLMATPTPGLLLSVPEFYQELADEFNIAYEGDIIAEVESRSALKSDAIHPNEKGYHLIAVRLAELLKEYGAY